MNRWWPDAVLDAILPESAMRVAFVAELPSLPLCFFEERAPSVPLPEKLPCAYLQLSAGYDSEARDARRRGWSAHSLALNQLAILTHSEAVVNLLCRVLPAIA